METSIHNMDEPMSGVVAHEPNPLPANRPSRSSLLSRRTSRVEKSRSAHSSPRVAERRKTMSAFKRFATLDDHWDMMFGKKQEPDSQSTIAFEASRPMSWHPTSSNAPNFLDTPPFLDTYIEHGELHGLQTTFDDASAMTEVPPSTSTSSHTSSLPYQSPDELDDIQHLQINPQAYPFPAPPSYQQTLIYTHPALPFHPIPVQAEKGWPQLPQSKSAMPLEGNDRDFLPIQHPPKDLSTTDLIVPPETLASKTSGKVLVGMGLYDPPESRSTIISTSLFKGTGKGLILEETWQPPSEHDDADQIEDAGSDDEGSSDDEPPNVEENGQPDRVNLSGHSFFFEDEEAYSGDWWTHQLRYPSAGAMISGYRWG